ncbi:MAG: beta-phosphoglucomutase family hydrolase [Chitinophagaceae bacterium]
MQKIEVPQGIEALIFDLDGTLADTIQVHIDTWKKACEGYPISFTQSFYESINGMGLTSTVCAFHENWGISKEECEKIALHKQELFHNSMQGLTAIAPVEKIVKKYFGKKPMAIGSGAETPLIEKTLREIGLEKYFNVLVGSDKVKHQKPSPDTWLCCAALLGVEPSKCLVFEDSLLGMQGAIDAGMQYIDVRPFTTEPIF